MDLRQCLSVRTLPWPVPFATQRHVFPPFPSKAHQRALRPHFPLFSSVSGPQFHFLSCMSFSLEFFSKRRKATLVRPSPPPPFYLVINTRCSSLLCLHLHRLAHRSKILAHSTACPHACLLPPPPLSSNLQGQSHLSFTPPFPLNSIPLSGITLPQRWFFPADSTAIFILVSFLFLRYEAPPLGSTTGRGYLAVPPFRRC